ncbi:MAG: response regulator [Thermodesulfobacteriota bacterium]
MRESFLDGKKFLAVDDEPDVLQILREEIESAFPRCRFDEATTYDEAVRKLESENYDVVILDIMGVRGFDLLEMAVKRNMKVVMLTAHALNSDALKRAYEMRARAYLPKDKLGEIVPFLKDVLSSEFESGWKRVIKRLESFFDELFEPEWRKKIGY